MKESIKLLFYSKDNKLLKSSIVDQSHPEELEGQITKLFWNSKSISYSNFEEIEDTLLKAAHLDQAELAKKLVNNNTLGLQKVKNRSLENLSLEIFNYLIDHNLDYEEFDEDELKVEAKIIKIE